MKLLNNLIFQQRWFGTRRSCRCLSVRSTGGCGGGSSRTSQTPSTSSQRQGQYSRHHIRGLPLSTSTKFSGFFDTPSLSAFAQYCSSAKSANFRSPIPPRCGRTKWKPPYCFHNIGANSLYRVLTLNPGSKNATTLSSIVSPVYSIERFGESPARGQTRADARNHHHYDPI